MKFNRFILLALLILTVNMSALAQYTQDIPGFEDDESFKTNTFDNRGFVANIGYEAARNVEFYKMKAVPVVLGYKIIPKLTLGLMLRPTYLQISAYDLIEYSHYDENGNYVDEKTTTHYKGHDVLSMPLAIYVRFDFTGYRRNSPFVEATSGSDVLGKTGGYSSYMAGCRFGMGESNKQAFIVAAGLTYSDTELEDKYNFENFCKLTVKFGFEF